MLRACTLLIALVSLPVSAQVPFWADASTSEAPLREDLTTYRAVRVDLGGLQQALTAQATERSALALSLPLPEGGTAEVTLVEEPVLPPGLQARYPAIRTYLVRGAATGRLSVTPLGVSGLLFDEGGTVVIDPLRGHDEADGPFHAVYRTSSLIVTDALRASLSDDLVMLDGRLGPSPTRPAPTRPAAAERAAPIGETVRTYRLAVAVRGEYTVQRVGGSTARALALIVGSVNRVNAIFERDLAVRFQLVEDNDQIVYGNPDTDPFTTTGGDLLDETQATIDDVIGTENYDLGHLISFAEGGGLAGLGVACDPEAKSWGYSGVGRETTPFDLLVFPHELGHQLGAFHAFVQPSSDFDRDPFGVEPGPGYTIMSYPHFATYRRAEERVGYHFHAYSIDEMNVFVNSSFGSCGTDTQTGNDVPVVTAEASLTIPLGAFVTLDGTASDASGTALSYSWEQMDLYGDGTGAIPVIRALDPGPTSARTIPDLRRFLDGRPYPDESPLDQEAVYTFRLTVRDNVAGGGAVSEADTRVRVRTADGPFEVTSVPPETVYQVGDLVEVTWSVADSDNDEIGVTTVDVLVSTDNGETWTLAAENVANDGDAMVTMPTTPTADGRLMVRAVGAPFFAVAPERFTLSSIVSAVDEATPATLTVSPVWPNPASEQALVRVRLAEPTSLRATLYDALGRAVAVVEDGAVTGTVVLPLDVAGLAAGVYLLRVEGASFVETRRFVVTR